MIDQFQKYAERLQFLKPVCILLGLIAGVLLGVEIFGNPVPEREDALLIPSAVLLLWSILGFIGLNTFGNVPENTTEKIGFVARLGLKFRRFGFWLFAILFVLLGAATLLTTYRVVSIWLG